MATRRQRPVIVNIAEDEDFKVLSEKRYSFNWKSFKKTTTVYKLRIEKENDILGVMGIVDIPAEKRVEIKLLATSIENIGSNKVYDRVAGCLIVYACRIAITNYGMDACISLVPKTQLIKHYMQKYHMLNAGRQLFLEGHALFLLMREYIE